MKWPLYKCYFTVAIFIDFRVKITYATSANTEDDEDDGDDGDGGNGGNGSNSHTVAQSHPLANELDRIFLSPFRARVAFAIRIANGMREFPCRHSKSTATVIYSRSVL